MPDKKPAVLPIGTNWPTTPLFSTRMAIGRKCEQWCIERDIPVIPMNIITAGFVLGLLKWEPKE